MQRDKFADAEWQDIYSMPNDEIVWVKTKGGLVVEAEYRDGEEHRQKYYSNSRQLPVLRADRQHFTRLQAVGWLPRDWTPPERYTNETDEEEALERARDFVKRMQPLKTRLEDALHVFLKLAPDEWSMKEYRAKEAAIFDAVDEIILWSFDEGKAWAAECGEGTER